MAVDAGQKRSFFTQQLASRLEQEGIATPSFILDLLDKPFAAFSEEDRQIYEKQVKEKELLVLFARLMHQIYESSSESARHSWKGMCHLLKDSPIKVCAAYAISQEEQRGMEREQAPTAAPRARPEPAPAGKADEGEGYAPVAGVPNKSFFTKKLQRKLDERGIKVPAPIIALLDKPFEDFTPEDQKLYESEFKGRQLTILFSDLLDELYEETGRVSSGWNAMCRFLKDTPMKLIATYVVQEEERLEEVAKAVPEDAGPQQPKQKFNVKRYQPKEAEQKQQQSRWRKK